MAAQVGLQAGPEEPPPPPPPPYPPPPPPPPPVGVPVAVAEGVGKPAAKRQKRDEGEVVYSSLYPSAPEHHDSTAPATARPTWGELDPDVREKIQGSNPFFKPLRGLDSLCPEVRQVGDELLASAEHGGPLAWLLGAKKPQVAMSFCGTCNGAVVGRFNVHCKSVLHKGNHEMRAAGWEKGEKAFARTTTLTGSGFEEIPLDLTGSVDGTFDESAQKNAQVTLFMYGVETAQNFTELNATEPVIANARLDKEGRWLEGGLADNAFDANLKLNGDADFCASQNGGKCPNPGNCQACAGLTEEEIANGALGGYARVAENLSQASLSRNKANGSAPIRVCVAVSGTVDKAPLCTSDDTKVVDVQHGGKFALSRKSLDQVGLFTPTDRSENKGCVSLANVLIPTGAKTDPANIGDTDGTEAISIPQKLIGDIKGDTCGSMWSPTILSLCFATGRREISVKVILEPGFTYEIGDCGLISFWKKMPMLSDTLLTRYKAEAIADGATADGGDEGELVSGDEDLQGDAEDLSGFY